MPTSKKSTSHSAKSSPRPSVEPSEDAPADAVEELPVVSPGDLQTAAFPPEGIKVFYQLTVVSEKDVLCNLYGLQTMESALSPSMLDFTARHLSGLIDMQLAEPAKVHLNAFLRRIKELSTPPVREESQGRLQLPARPPIPSPTLDAESEEAEEDGMDEEPVVDALPPPAPSQS